MFWVGIGIVGVIVYIAGVVLVASSETIENVKFHDGGLFNMGYTTNDNRELSAKDVRKGLIWPGELLFYFLIGILFFMNELLMYFLLIFNYKYKNTKMYKKISYWFLGI